MDTTQTDVIIVGAGPTGLALACQFLRYGVDFVIVDKSDGLTPFSRAIGVQARTLEIYDQIGLAEELVSQGTITEKAKFLEGGKVRGEVELADWGKGLSAFPFLLIVEQSKHERLLYDYLTSGGKEVGWQTNLERFTQDESGVQATITTASGESRTIKAKYLVGCDGAKSAVRHGLGLVFEGSTFERLFYVADVQIDWQDSHDALLLCLAQHTLTAFFPMRGENRYRILGTLPEEQEQRNEADIPYEEIEQQIRADTKLDLAISQVNWFSVYRVHSRRVNKFSEGRCFVAGDAAHIHTPAGGQGMNTGIQDGYNLAWKLALVLRGSANAGLLETYNAERLENAKHLLDTTDKMFDLASSDHWFTVYFRTRILPHIGNLVLHIDAVKRFIFPLISQIGIQYRHSSLSQHAGDAPFAVKAGDRMPYFLVDGANVYDTLREPKFHLLIFGNAQSAYDALKAELESRYATLVDVRLFPLSPQVRDIFGADKAFGVLLRPDNYIGFIASAIGISAITDYLNGFVGVLDK